MGHVLLLVRQRGRLTATAAPAERLLHQTLVQAVVAGGGGLGVPEMRVPVMAVHQLPYFRVFVADVVAELRLLEARRAHPLVAGCSAAGRVRRVEARLDQRLARLRRDHRLQLPRGKRVDVARLGGHQEHHLGAGQRGQFVGLEGKTRRIIQLIRGFVGNNGFTTKCRPQKQK